MNNRWIMAVWVLMIQLMKWFTTSKNLQGLVHDQNLIFLISTSNVSLFLNEIKFCFQSHQWRSLSFVNFGFRRYFDDFQRTRRYRYLYNSRCMRWIIFTLKILYFKYMKRPDYWKLYFRLRKWRNFARGRYFNKTSRTGKSFCFYERQILDVYKVSRISCLR